MIYGGLKKVEEKSGEFIFDDFGKFTEYTESYYTDGGKLIPAPSVSIVGELPAGLNSVKAYDVGFTLYYCSDGKLYRKTGQGFSAYGVPSLTTSPDVFTCVYDGKQTVVAVCKTGAYLLNDTVSFVNIPKGNAYSVYKGTLFIAKGNRIIVCSNGFTGEDVSVNPDNFLYPSGTYGAVLGFSVISGELYAFMKRGVIKITLTGEDTEYSLKDCGVAPFKVVDKTFKSTGDETYFIGINGLNRFNGKRVQKLKSMLDGIKYDISGEAQVSDNLYLLPITVNGTRKIYCYDVINEKDCLIKNDSLIAGKNAVSPTTGSIGEITTVNSNRKWVSVSTDLNKVGKKTLYSLSLDSEKDVSVQVSGDGITRSFTLGKNHPEAHPLIRAEKFIFTFTTADENQKSVISNVVAKYRI